MLSVMVTRLKDPLVTAARPRCKDQWPVPLIEVTTWFGGRALALGLSESIDVTSYAMRDLHTLNHQFDRTSGM